MQSKFTIQVNYSDKYGRPYIRVIEALNSDDLRDKIVNEFRYNFQNASMWCKVDFGEKNEKDGTLQWYISPIPPHELEEEAKQMLETVRVSVPVERSN